MAKKTKSLPKDDLLDQLLDDVNDIAADPSLEDNADAVVELSGLHTDVRAKAPAAAATEENPWDALGGVAEAPVPEADPNDVAFGLPPAPDAVANTGVYQGPSAGDGGYQSLDDLNQPIAFESFDGEQDATRPLSPAQGLRDEGTMPGEGAVPRDTQATQAAGAFTPRRPAKSAPDEKVVIGSLRGSRTGNVFTSVDASLAQAENLKLAQQRILDLEKENDRLRQENEEVSSAADIIRSRLEELSARITAQEREKSEIQEANQNEVMILKGNLQYKESEVAKARLKIDELETRLRNDFKKIRVKERELENRLELARAEKAALVRAKDENILELKRKIDHLQSEIDNYRDKLLELNKTIDSNQEQFKRTVRALRLALSNLEAKDDNVVPLKKAE